MHEIKIHHYDKYGNVWSLYECSCGDLCVTRRSYVRTGHTKSCGHLKRVIRNRLTHGESNSTTEYLAWASMKRRCLNPNTKDWKDYGGRGIRICPSWHTYKYFLEDMGRKPSPKHSLDRINVEGNYEPKNCRWATPKQQANNRRIKMVEL